MALPLKSNQLIVVSGGAADPTISAGTADPSTGFAGPEGSIYLRYVASAGQLFVKTGPGDTDWGFTPIGASGCTLDQAYDFGGLGAGRTITADAGAIQIDANTIDAQAALVINRNPASAAGAIGINMTLGANVNTLGNGLQITDGGTGNSIYVQKNAAGVVLAANLTDPGAQALTVTVNGAPTSVSPVSIVANQTGTTASLLSISKIPSGSTAGAALAVSMGANTTGPGITVSQAGSGAAIQVLSGAIEMANSSPGVSAANEGRIKYNSTTQTFQASMNGSAYADLGGGGGGSGLFASIMSAHPTQASTGLTSWYNQPASATVEDNLQGISVFCPNAGSVNNPAYRVTSTVPATPYSIKVLVSLTGPIQSTTFVAIGFSNGTANTNPIQVMAWSPTQSNLQIINYTNFSTFSSTPYNQTGITGAATWLRIRDDGTTIYYAYSMSGNDNDFIDVFTTLKSSSFLGSGGYTNILFGAFGFNGDAHAALLDWSQGV